MKITIETASLKKILDNAWEFTSKKASLSMSSFFYLKASDDKLSIKASNVSAGFQSSVTAIVQEQGETVVNAEKLREIIKTATGYDTLELFTKDDKLSIKNSGKKKFQLNIRTLSPDKFPELKTAEGLNFNVYSMSDFLYMTDLAIPMVSTDMSRVFLTGVYMTKENNKLVLVATDGKRLAKIARDADNLSDFPGAIVPVNFLNSIKTISTGEGLLEFAIKDNTLFVKINETSIYTGLLSGRFPEYNRVIPKSFAFRAEMDTKDMKTSLGIIENTSSKANGGRIELKLSKNGGCSISSTSDENDGNYELIGEFNGSDDMSIMLAEHLLKSMIAKIPDEKFYFQINTATAAIGIEWNSDPKTSFILMPISR